MTTLNYLDYARQSTVFERIAATTACCQSPVLGGERPIALATFRVSPPYFDILGIAPAYGRTFVAGEDEPGRNRVVVLSHKAWAKHFGLDPTLVGRSIRAAIEKVEALPGVEGVAFSDGMPMHGAPTGTFFQIASRPPVERAQRPLANLRLVSPSYFRVLALRLRRGRLLNESDRADTPLVTVINETMARKYFGADDPVGQRLLMDSPGFSYVYSGEASSYEIVGVIADEQIWPFGEREEPAAVYVSNEQNARGFSGILVRTSLDPSAMERGLRAAIAAIDKDQPIDEVRTIDQLKAESMAPDRLRSGLLGAFAVMALALAAIGIYGVISYTVVQRTHEIGIRAALGASPTRLVGLVVRQGIGFAAIGLALGAAGSIGVARLLRSFLFGVGSSDPTTLVASVAVLATVAAIACYLPARHAADADPLDALRVE